MKFMLIFLSSLFITSFAFTKSKDSTYRVGSKSKESCSLPKGIYKTPRKNKFDSFIQFNFSGKVNGKVNQSNTISFTDAWNGRIIYSGITRSYYQTSRIKVSSPDRRELFSVSMTCKGSRLTIRVNIFLRLNDKEKNPVAKDLKLVLKRSYTYTPLKGIFYLLSVRDLKRNKHLYNDLATLSSLSGLPRPGLK